MRLAFTGEAKYPDFEAGYELYKKRSRSRACVDRKTYNRIVRAYCGRMRDKLLQTGLVDFPNEIGSVAAAVFTQKPQYRGDKFIGYGKMDYNTWNYDGTLHAFGLVFFQGDPKDRTCDATGSSGTRDCSGK